MIKSIASLHAYPNHYSNSRFVAFVVSERVSMLWKVDLQCSIHQKICKVIRAYLIWWFYVTNELKHNCLIIPFFGRYTKETQSKRRVHFSYEADPSVTMFSATWNRKNLFALHKAWFVNLSARLVRVDLSGNHIEELPEELLNTLPLLEVLDVSNNKLQYLPEVTSTFTRYFSHMEYDIPLSLIQYLLSLLNFFGLEI